MDSTIIEEYFPNLTNSQKAQFAKLGVIYGNWNKQINVISRKDIGELYIRHVLHSLAIAKYIKFADETVIVDIGTGGGFPGIPLAILFPKCKFYLTDSIGKKIKVVEGVINELGLTNVYPKHLRIEQLNVKPHFYVTRAVAPLQTIKNWISNNINKTDQFNLKPNGIIALKGGDLSNELQNFNDVEVVPVKNYFKEDYFDTKFIVHHAL